MKTACNTLLVQFIPGEIRSDRYNPEPNMKKADFKLFSAQHCLIGLCWTAMAIKLLHYIHTRDYGFALFFQNWDDVS